MNPPPPRATCKSTLKIERETHKLEKRLCRQVGQAIVDYNMIEEGDRVMVCLSAAKTATPCWTSCSKCRPVRR
jgi:tRNA 2-thiocytidine biosynthesis protein TtcA